MVHVKTDRLSRPASAKGLFLSIQFCVHVQKFEKKKKLQCQLQRFASEVHCSIYRDLNMWRIRHWKKNYPKFFFVILKRLDPTAPITTPILDSCNKKNCCRLIAIWVWGTSCRSTKAFSDRVPVHVTNPWIDVAV